MKDTISIVSINDILKVNLDIPNYQRPYKWKSKNVIELLEDINKALEEAELNKDYKYRIGTILLHSDNDKYNIVDGQQRLLTLVLIKYYLDNNFKCSLLSKKYIDKITKENLHYNYECIENWFSLKDSLLKEKINNMFENILEVVVIVVENIAEAFQLFDSQNNRGKSPDPHDLLKAYHLREMMNNKYEMEQAVKKWESIEPSKIKSLFDNYLFQINKWSKKEKTKQFTTDDIDIYKGVKENLRYSYAKRTIKASPLFQITEPFVAGNDFFSMVDHYIEMLQFIEKELENNYKSIYNFLNDNTYKRNMGFTYATNLFKCALLCFYDRFNILDKIIVKKLFLWAMTLRIDMDVLGFDSINKYAIGESTNVSYSNTIPMFNIISNSLKHTDIENLHINYSNKENSMWLGRHTDFIEKIKKIMEE